MREVSWSGAVRSASTEPGAAYRGGGRDSSWRVAQRGDVFASSPPLRNHSHVTGPRWSHDPPPSSVSVLSRLRCKDVRVKGSSPRRAGTRPGQPANRSQSVYPAGHLQPTVARCKAGLTGATLLMRLQWSRDLWPCSKGRVPHSHSGCYNRGCSLAEPGRSTSLSLSRVVSGRGFFLYMNGSQCSCAFQSVWARDPRPHVWFRAYILVRRVLGLLCLSRRSRNEITLYMSAFAAALSFLVYSSHLWS